MVIQFDEKKQEQKLSDLQKKEEEDLAKILAERYNMEYVDLLSIPIDMDSLRVLDENDARTSNVAPFSMIDRNLKLAIKTPNDQRSNLTIKNLEKDGYSIKTYIASEPSLEKVWNAYKDLSYARETSEGSIEIAHDEIVKIIQSKTSLIDIKSTLETILSDKKNYKTSRILEHVIAGALVTKASDIHIEPEEKSCRLRYRLDGVLVDVVTIDNQTFNLLLSRIKLISGMKLNIKKDSQDGRFSIKLKDADIEVRSSILPGAYSESIVLRLLNPDSISVPLEELGIPKKLLSVVLEQIEKPNGMILTTGPTGSGKTTTLYAFIKKVYNPGVKIITIEDPIEYHLSGIVQTQVNEKGYTFLEGLRSALRQDPDIIMIGEIRDAETAGIAINSSLTGHLVFSTLHTNNAAGSFPRLIDLDVNPKVISSAINIAMAQRLVRRLCQFCKKEVILEGTDKQKIEKVISGIVEKESIPKEYSKIWKSVGCEKCNGTGYKGRIGIYEGILMDQSVNKTVEESLSASEIALSAKPQGILSIAEDGVLKVLSGITSLDELERVVDISQ